MEEIVVSAQKQGEQRLQDVPVPVSAISARALVDSNKVRLQDYYNTIPGFTVTPTPSGGAQPVLAIRGITNGVGTNQTVGVIIDDVPYGSSTSIGGGGVIPDIDPGDLERIEVLRGPQGTLYGASSMGGLLKYVTVDPSRENLSGRVEVGINSTHNGDGMGNNLRGSVNVPLGESAALRASGLTRRDAGYIDNPRIGERGANEVTVSGGRLALMVWPTETMSIRLSGLYQDYDADSFDFVSEAPGFDTLEQNYMPGTGQARKQVQAYSAGVDLDLGAAKLSSVTGYNVNEYRSVIDFSYAFSGLVEPRFGVTGAAVDDYGTNKKFTQELRLQAPVTDKMDVFVGGYYGHEDSINTEDAFAANIDSGSIVGLYYHIPFKSKYEEYALFTNVTYRFSEKFDIQVGARQSWIDQQLDETIIGPFASDFYGGSPVIFPQGTTSAEPFTYLLTPRFYVSPDFMIYGRVASGYRPGGPNLNISGEELPDTKPDKTENFEFGAKASFFDRKLTVDASVYTIEWTDIQLLLVDPNTNFNYQGNGGKARSQGIEFAISTKPIPSLSVDAWVVYSDATLAQTLAPPDFVIRGNKGDRLAFNPEFSAYLSLEQRFPISGNVEGFVGTAASLVGKRFGPFQQNSLIRQVYPSYTKVDLRTGFTTSDWTANLYVDNLTDERGLIGGGIGSFPPTDFQFIRPRTVGLSFAKTF